ncbi:flippase [Halorarius litoreus]|uniref:flippase n=1 Tax=Halorarius litoreus TaxID=2962676 RepID=UPI0020CB901C|nr:flippase [Halorarius litoreus]
MDIEKSSSILFISKIVTTGITFIAILYFSREFGPSQIGIFFLFQSLLNLISVPTDLGIRSATEKRISEGMDPRSVLGTAIVSKILLLFIATISILIFRVKINDYIGHRLAYFLIVGLILHEATELLTGVLKGELRVSQTALLEFIKQTTWVGAGVGLSQFGLEGAGMVYALIISLGLTSIFGGFLIHTQLAWPRYSALLSLVHYAKYNIIAIIGSQVYNWIDVAIIGYLLTRTSVGIYEVTWRISAIAILFSKSYTATTFPVMSQWFEKRRFNEIQHLLTDSISYGALLTIPASCGVILLSTELIHFTFGKEYLPGATVLVILMINRLAESLQLTFRSGLQAIDRPDLAAKAALLGTCLNILLNIMLGMTFGLEGIAVGTLLSMVLGGVILNFYYLNSHISVIMNKSEIGWILISSVGMSIIIETYLMFYSIESTLELITFIFCLTVIYLCLMYPHPSLRHKIAAIAFQDVKNTEA